MHATCTLLILTVKKANEGEKANSLIQTHSMTNNLILFFPSKINKLLFLLKKKNLFGTWYGSQSPGCIWICVLPFQVRELHRLYRRQRELMDEIKRRMLSDRNLHSDSTAFVPKISSEAVHGTSQNPSLPWVNPTASRLPVSSAENFWSTSS